jgi:3-oxoadipate enol-lactonase
MLFNAQFGKLHYDMVGDDADPIVCMAHSLTSDSGMWAEQVPFLLQAGFRVLRLDMRGHGGSDSTPGDYSMAMLAHDVVTVWDHLKIERTHLVGLSIGGMISQVLAIEHGQRLLSCMLCDTVFRSPYARAEVPRRNRLVTEARSLLPLVDLNMERRYSNAFKERRPERWSALRATYLNTSIDGYLGCSSAIRDFDVSERLSSVRTPTLVLCGSDDLGTPPASNKELAQRIPGGRYVEIPKGRHFPNVEFAEQFNEIMLSWLPKHRR